MTDAHIHLALVHIPVLFVPFALALLMASLWRKQVVLQKLAALIFLGSAVVGIPTFLSGEPAEHLVEDIQGVSEHHIEEHEEAAEFAFYLTLFAGSLALGTLLTHRKPKVQKALKSSLIVAGLLSSLALLRTANLGGQIRHSEIRPQPQP